MKVDAARLIKVGYDFSADRYLAVFEIAFHFMDDDCLSDLPGYEYLEDRVAEEIDNLLDKTSGGVDLWEEEREPVYQMQAPTRLKSWGVILWTETRQYRPEELEKANPVLRHWERAVRHAQLMSGAREQDQHIVWADSAVLDQPREA